MKTPDQSYARGSWFRYNCVSMRLACALLLLSALPWAATRAWAIGEVVTDVRIENAVRTQEETVRSIAGVNIGDVLEMDTLDKVRERLHTSGLFADVNVYWKPHRDGVQVNIVIKDKFPWAPVPTFSYSPGNTSGGLFIGHGNLFGRGKRGAIGGRISTVDSGALVAYDDPAVFGSWLFWRMVGRFQDQVLPEYSNDLTIQKEYLLPIRETKLRSWGGEVHMGVAWLRKVKTSVGWNIERFRVLRSDIVAENPYAPADLPWAAEDATRGLALANVTFDFRAREHAVMYGNALSFTFDYGTPQLGSDEKLRYWKASVSYEQGIRFFRKHNFILRVGGTLGENLPFWSENSTNGNNLRGFVYRQFMGDTLLRSQAEYHFPMLSVGTVEVRGLIFNDTAAIYYRKLPEDIGNMYDVHPNGRQYLPPALLVAGFDPNRDVHTSVGAGIRFFLRSVAVPLVGVDFGHGIGTGTVRIVIVVGL